MGVHHFAIPRASRQTVARYLNIIMRKSNVVRNNDDNNTAVNRCYNNYYDYYYCRDESTPRSTIIPHLIIYHYRVIGLSSTTAPPSGVAGRWQRGVCAARIPLVTSHDHVGSPASNSPVSGLCFSDGQTDVGLANARDYIFHENSIIR